MMDAIFSLGDEVVRAEHLRLLMQYFGATYICLWSNHPFNFLYLLDGYYQEESNPDAGSSSGSQARRLFNEYQREVFFVVDKRVPGLAFTNNRPYVELNESNLQTMASIAVQRQFYQEARIKTAAFMGCKSGEIELGWSNATQITNMEDKMKSWFPEDFSGQSPRLITAEMLYQIDSNRPSSSSSSLKSLSMDSPESSPLYFNINSRTPTAAHIESIQEQQAIHESLQRTIDPSTTTTTTTIDSPLHQVISQALQPFVPSQQPIQAHQKAMQAFAMARNVQLPSQESEEAAITRAILTVLTSSASAASSYPCSTSNPNLLSYYNPTSSSPFSTSNPNLLPYNNPPPSVRRWDVRNGAFKKYQPLIGTKVPGRASSRRHSMLKRSITYYRSLSIVRREHMMVNRPTSTQLHHMISERKRREKINESFQALRSLLPPETKKDKASILIHTRDYLKTMKDQVAELIKRKEELETRLSIDTAKEASAAEEPSTAAKYSNERLTVGVAHLLESTSQRRTVELQVNVRGECPVSDVVIEILEFLKRDENVNLTSMEANSLLVDSTPLNRFIFRLQIEEEGWDESAFQEAIRRIVAEVVFY